MKLLIAIIIVFMMMIKIKLSRYNIKRELKKCESPIERIFVEALYEKGYKPYTQVTCGKFRIDVAIFYRGKKIAIECDGKAYHTSPEQIIHDEKKDLFLEKNRWVVYRFTGSEINRNVDVCIEKIKNRT